MVGRSGRRLSIGLPGSSSKEANEQATKEEPVIGASEVAAALGLYEVKYSVFNSVQYSVISIQCSVFIHSIHNSQYLFTQYRIVNIREWYEVAG